MESATTKSEIRKACLAARRALTPEEARARSAAILERLRRLPEFATARTCLCYVSSKDNEVDTHGLIGELLSIGRRVLVPIAEPAGTMAWSRLESLAELAPARFGILEPRPECRRDADVPDDSIVIVPGIAFSPNGNRIGYGGGYFDRFLRTYPGRRIALAFDLQIVRDTRREPHDVPVDAVVTESRVYRRQTNKTQEEE